VGVGTAQDHGLKHARQLKVVGVQASSSNVPGTFFAATALADEFIHLFIH
jgi:hypothetical protein